MKKNPGHTAGNPTIPGATICFGGVNFTIDITGKELVDNKLHLVLYKKGTTKVSHRILFKKDYFYGNVASMKVAIIPGDFDYAYMTGSGYIGDKYAVIVNGMESFGRSHRDIITYGIYVQDFVKKPLKADKKKSEEKKKVSIPLEDAIIYKLHVRGFTMHESSGVTSKGTFRGVTEKIPYLKDLGVNVIELMPAYEFDDVLFSSLIGDDPGKLRIKPNYWGYSDAYYYAPKKAYSEGNPTEEFKFMVDKFHENQMEVVMEFYFVPGTSKRYIVDCLRFWKYEYDVDGFMVNTNVVPVDVINTDPLLSDVKIYTTDEVDMPVFDKRKKLPKKRAIYSENYYRLARKFLLGKANSFDMANAMKNNDYEKAIVNYVSNHGTFSLMDTFSYNIKRNETNGEGNLDGSNENLSMNCGMEGPADRMEIISTRHRMVKNALALLLLSQGTPLIYAGDEMGHTCYGNNNPYCQDNDVNYIDYRDIHTNKDIYEFTKLLIKLRKEHVLLHMKNPSPLNDYLSYGCSDISFHGREPFKLDHGNHFALLINGKYGKKIVGKSLDNIYAAFNMGEESVTFIIPELNKKPDWKLFCATFDSAAISDINVVEGNAEDVVIECAYTEGNEAVTVPARSVIILIEKGEK